MTPEQRLDRTERIVMRLVKAGYRARREMRDQARLDEEMAKLAESDRLIREMLLSSRKRRNRKSD